MPELTKQGYDMIVDRIDNIPVKMPDGMTLAQVEFWMRGYIKCQDDIIALVEKLKELNGR